MYKNIMQVAWVTTDVERAVAIFEKDQGVDLQVFPGFALPVFDSEPLVIDVALGYVGEMQFEIIQPVSGPTDLYSRHLPTTGEFALTFHHMCSEFASLEEYESALDEYRGRGVTIEVDGAFGEGGRFFYADTRASVDHYQEYVLLDPTTREFLATLPRN